AGRAAAPVRGPPRRRRRPAPPPRAPPRPGRPRADAGRGRRAVREEQGGRRVRRDELGAGVEPPPLQQGGGGAVRRGAERGGAGRVRAALRPLPPPHGVRLLNGLLRRCAASTSPSLHSPPLTTGSGTTRPGWPAPSPSTSA